METNDKTIDQIAQDREDRLRLAAVKLGTELFIHMSAIYDEDPEMRDLVSSPIENAEQFYEFLKGDDNEQD